MPAPAEESCAGRQPYFLGVGFLAVGEVWLLEAWVGLAELVLGLLPVGAGLAVPFQESMELSPRWRLRRSEAIWPAQLACEW